MMVIVMLALLELTVLSSLGGTADDADEVVLRIETLRAFYAAESGAVLALSDELRGLTPPGTGDELLLPNARVEFLQTPWDDEGDVLTVEGRSDAARRRIQISLE
ncbi:MAG: hypothetical protein H6810_11420 [Phycisphaeraceae bacterium]|nr:MAG: hypothetical protein H6810_11420 [Phycisphaeraceae bacterium]